ncbi:hypothetical protein B0H34DRAFT_454599 [Crassisporium funariophilum]|nr:hypothetical protein B0H34DRAFT_454599 [Crassisporium funariophilum]
MAAGMLLAPRAQGSKRKRFGAKPKILDTWLADGGEKWAQMMPLSAQPVFVKRKIKEGTAPKATSTDEPSLPANPTSTPNNEPNSSTNTPTPIPNTPTEDTASRISRLMFGPTGRFSRHLRSPDAATELHPPNPADPAQPSPNAHAHANATAAAAAAGATPGYRVRVEMLQISVLIQMPSPSRSQRKNTRLDKKTKEIEDDDEEDEEEEGEGELPYMVFGVTRVNYRQPKVSSASGTALPVQGKQPTAGLEVV